MDKDATKVMATLNNIAYALYRVAAANFHGSCMAETRLRFEECPEDLLSRLVPLLKGQCLPDLLRENMRGARKGAAAKAGKVG